jgi:hypothetical protein
MTRLSPINIASISFELSFSLTFLVLLLELSRFIVLCNDSETYLQFDIDSYLYTYDRSMNFYYS